MVGAPGQVSSAVERCQCTCTTSLDRICDSSTSCARFMNSLDIILNFELAICEKSHCGHFNDMFYIEESSFTFYVSLC